MTYKIIKWVILSGALTLMSCASTNYEKPLPVPSKGKSNIQFISETGKLLIEEIQNKINTEQPAQNCEEAIRLKNSPHPQEDVKPLIRIPPVIPHTINLSGYCQVRFTVTKIGTTRDIELLVCTHEALARPTIKSVSKWTYTPKTINGKKYDRCSNEARIHFTFSDSRGKKIPVPEGF